MDSPTSPCTSCRQLLTAPWLTPTSTLSGGCSDRVCTLSKSLGKMKYLLQADEVGGKCHFGPSSWKVWEFGDDGQQIIC